MLKKIIGIAAPARSGKDTVASLLLQHNNFTAYALADPLKLGCQALFGLTEDETWNDKIKEKTIPLWQYSPRKFFQHVGTDWMRSHNPEHWLMRAERAINHPTIVSSLSPHTLPSKAPINLATQAFFGLTTEQTWDHTYSDSIDKFWGMSPRKMFDLIEYRVTKDFPDYFERRRQHPVIQPTRVIPFINKNEIIIIKDIRFENEADFLRRQNGVIWHIIRDNAQKVTPHASESGITVKEKDVVIDNNGTLEQLAIEVEQKWLHFIGKSI